jgi:LemA protein
LNPATSRLKIVLIALPALLVAAAGSASTYVEVRNSLAAQRAAINSAWTGLNDALRERAALIGKLAELSSQLELRKEIADASGQLLGNAAPRERIKANQRLSGYLAKLLLAADTGAAKPGRAFSLVQEQIRDNDERVAVARLKYNETLEHYNARIQTFPNNLVAKLAGFRRNDAYFQTEPF